MNLEAILYLIFYKIVTFIFCQKHWANINHIFNMYDFMMKNMLLVNIIFKETVIILTIKHSPVNRHKLINNQYPCYGETIRHKLSEQSSE